MIKSTTLAAFLLFPLSGFSQTFTGTGGHIPDAGAELLIDLEVSGLPVTMNEFFGLETACLTITHTYISDLNITLISPTGVAVDLSSGNGGDSDFYTNTCFNQSAETSIIAGQSPYDGTFRPEGSLAQINNGSNPNGTWRLHLIDVAAQDEGDLLSWSISFGNAPAIPYSYSGGFLPIVSINTLGNPIENEPKVEASMGIIDNGPGVFNNATDSFNSFNGSIGIEYRGNSSQNFPKKSYGFEIWDITQNDSDAVILGMPEESDFVLHSSFSDKTMMRNALTYSLYGAMGHYSPRCRFVELMLNGEYQGVYVLMEKIKRDANRVDISKLLPEDIEGNELTGGYIIKIDWGQGSFTGGWKSVIGPCDPNSLDTIFYQYEYPDGNEIQPQQADYIQNYVSDFERSLTEYSLYDTVIGYRHYVDTKSMIDAMIINELAKNVDGYRLSTFFTKDKDSKGGKLASGPLWDFDLAWRNANYYEGDNPFDWQYYNCGDGAQNPAVWKYFMEDSVFRNELKCRWTELREGILSTPALFSHVDSLMQVITPDAIDRNFDYWQILGTYVWPNPEPIPESYEGEIWALKSWISTRAGWLDGFIPGICPPEIVTSINNTTENKLNLFPDPAENELNLRSDKAISHLRITDLSGRIVLQLNGNNQSQLLITISDFNSGMYFCSLYYSDGSTETTCFVRR